MRIYIDEDLSSGLLTRILQKAGHDVLTAVTAGTLGSSDAAQLTFAIRDLRVCLSRNYDDFEELHFLVQAAQGQHQGIVIVRRENDPTRNLTPKGIVTAIGKLEAASAPVANEYIILNQWR